MFSVCGCKSTGSNSTIMFFKFYYCEILFIEYQLSLVPSNHQIKCTMKGINDKRIHLQASKSQIQMSTNFLVSVNEATVFHQLINCQQLHKYGVWFITAKAPEFLVLTDGTLYIQFYTWLHMQLYYIFLSADINILKIGLYLFHTSIQVIFFKILLDIENNMTLLQPTSD